MKSTLALALLLGGLLIGCQARTPSPAPRPAASAPPMVDYPPGSLGLRRQFDETPITPFETIGAAATD
jgi:hypothetical protein